MGYNYKIGINLKSPKMAAWSLLVLTLLSSILIGHFLHLLVSFIIPMVISMFASFVFLINTNLTLFRKSVICYLFIGLNDIGIKQWAGGIHDAEGHGWIHMMLFIGLVPAFAILIISVIKDQATSLQSKIISAIIFTTLIFFHIYLFGDLGTQ